jgi:Zn-dependent M16 (insulinase) family peptidase
VVFSEMKGVYSSPDSLLAEYSQQSLFPDTTYGFDSGGRPEEIPSLIQAGALRRFRVSPSSNSRPFMRSTIILPMRVYIFTGTMNLRSV